MDIKYRLYPYPVLAEFNDSYLNVEFTVTSEVVQDGFDIVVKMKNVLTDEILQSFIATGKAMFVYHLECAETGYRNVFETDKYEYNIPINGSKISGDLHICPFILAKEDILDYYNPNFNPFYKDSIDKIEKGCMLAIGKHRSYPIKKNPYDMLNSSSPFRILKNMDESQRHMVVEYESESRIKIKIAAADCALYKSMRSDPRLHDILNSAIVVPALVYVLGQLQYIEADDLESNFGQLAWYIAIKNSLKKNFNKDISKLRDENIYELSQKMLKIPISSAIENLANLGGSDKGDEDE